MIIDCAFDEKLASELKQYLSEKGFAVSDEDNGIIKVDEPKLSKEDLESFLKKTDRDKEYQLIPAGDDTVIIAINVTIEDFGLGRCTICGFVAYPDELIAHERAHGIQFVL
jgi:hypothetical protein